MDTQDALSAKGRRIGLFGGTFNPPHNGHIALAEAFLAQAWVDEVWMMVSPQNPFKANQQLLDDTKRLDMVRLASFDRWYRNEEVLDMASLYVYPREGQPIDTHLPRGVHQLDAPLVNISSTSVRERVANGEEIATLVPKAVADYIVCQRLYQSEAKGG